MPRNDQSEGLAMYEDTKSGQDEVGKVITFYSYKGGVGRSMALANIGVLLAREEYRVLLLDWDLEAPGLETYFGGSNTGSQTQLSYKSQDRPGVIDILLSADGKSSLSWRECINTLSFSGGKLDLISAGKRDSSYKKRLRELDWGMLYEERSIGDFLDEMRQELKENYDFILVDSRTGITDIGDICTVLLPDILVTLFIANRQNIDGCREIVERAQRARQKLPVDRSKLVVVPVAARDESDSEYEQATHWRVNFKNAFGDLTKEWLPDSVSVGEYFDRFYIPYVPNWSFGERVPVLESPRETSDPKTIGASYLSLTRLLENDLEWYPARGSHAPLEIDDLKTRDMRIREIEAQNVVLGEIREKQSQEFEVLNARLEKEAFLRERAEEEREKSRRRVTWLGSVAGVISVMSASAAYYAFQQAQANQTEALLNERIVVIQNEAEAERERLLSLVDDLRAESAATEATVQRLLQALEGIQNNPGVTLP